MLAPGTRLPRIEPTGVAGTAYDQYLKYGEVREQHSRCLGKALHCIFAKVPGGGAEPTRTVCGGGGLKNKLILRQGKIPRGQYLVD